MKSKVPCKVLTQGRRSHNCVSVCLSCQLSQAELQPQCCTIDFIPLKVAKSAVHCDQPEGVRKESHFDPGGTPEEKLVPVSEVSLRERRGRSPERVCLEPPRHRPAARRHRSRQQLRQWLGEDRPHHRAAILRRDDEALL